MLIPNVGQHAFLSLLVFCGLRVSEALGADVDDLADARGHRVIRVIGKAAGHVGAHATTGDRSG